MLTERTQKMMMILVVSNHICRRIRKSGKQFNDIFAKAHSLLCDSFAVLLKDGSKFTTDKTETCIGIDNIAINAPNNSLIERLGKDEFERILSTKNNSDRYFLSMTLMEDKMKDVFSFIPPANSINEKNANEIIDGMRNIYIQEVGIQEKPSAVVKPEEASPASVKPNSNISANNTVIKPSNQSDIKTEAPSINVNTGADEDNSFDSILAAISSIREQHRHLKADNEALVMKVDGLNSVINEKASKITELNGLLSEQSAAMNRNMSYQKDLQKKISDLEASDAEKEKSILSLNEAIQKAASEQKRLNQDIGKKDTEIQQLNQNISDYAAKIANYETQLGQVKRNYQKRAGDLNSAHEKAMNESAKKYEAQIGALTRQHDEEMATLSTNSKNHLLSVIREYEDQLQAERDKYSKLEERVKELELQLKAGNAPQGAASVQKDDAPKKNPEPVAEPVKPVNHTQTAQTQAKSEQTDNNVKPRTDKPTDTNTFNANVPSNKPVKPQDNKQRPDRNKQENPTQKLDSKQLENKKSAQTSNQNTAGASKQPHDNQTNVQTEIQQAPMFGNFPYADNIRGMNRKDFCFNYIRAAVISVSTGLEAMSFEAIVAPLSTKEQFPDIVVWIGFGGRTSVYTSTKESKAIHTTVGNFPVVISGRMEGDTFKGNVALEPNMKDNYRTESSCRFFGKKGHILITEAGIKVHVIPATFKNNEEGTANFIYVVDDGKGYKAGDNSSGDIHVYTVVDKVIQCSWNEQKWLYASLRMADISE